jgi:hypothetical protein
MPGKNPGLKKRLFGFVEFLSFQQIVKHLFTEGDSACPPERPLRFAIVSYYLLWRYRSREMPHRRGRKHFMP